MHAPPKRTHITSLSDSSRPPMTKPATGRLGAGSTTCRKWSSVVSQADRPTGTQAWLRCVRSSFGS